MANILIPDYAGQQVIAGIKSLSLHGDSCDLAWEIKNTDRLFKSKYIRDLYRIPAAREDSDDYAQALVNFLKNHPYDMILPFGNNANHAVNRAQDELRKYTRLLTPSRRAHEIAYDKQATAQHCRTVGIDAPATFFDYDEADLPSIANTLRYPVVIKARSGSGVKAGLRYATNQSELLAKYHELTDMIHANENAKYANPIIQEFIPGYVHDACLLLENGKTLAALTQIRQLMYPITGGVGAINYTTHNPELEAVATRLMESLEWTGPAEVEFKYDQRDKKYKLVEINPKLWGTLDLSIQSGVSFPVLIRNLLMGEKVTQPAYDAGNVYYFLYPQTSLARLQYLTTFGKWNPRLPVKITRKFHDVDWGDFKPLFGRFLKTAAIALTGKIANETRNLPKALINR
jgi:predicted ATP-grasp superfamily ATP-dependent carboligase